MYQRESFKNSPDVNWRYRFANLNRDVVVKMLRELANKLEMGQDEFYLDEVKIRETHAESTPHLPP